MDQAETDGDHGTAATAILQPLPAAANAAPAVMTYSSIPGNRNWQIETADWYLDVRIDI